MTKIKINNMLEATGGDLTTLERIATDETIEAELRITAFLALDEKYLALDEKHDQNPEQERYEDSERENLKVLGYSKNNPIW